MATLPSTDPSDIANAARCFSCNVTGINELALRTYLLTQTADRSTPPCVTPTTPNTPTVFQALENILKISWTQPANTGSLIMSYTVSYGTTSGGPYTSSVTVHQKQAILNGLTAGTTYYFVVKANAFTGCSSPNSTEQNATTGAGPACSNADATLWTNLFTAFDTAAPSAAVSTAVCVFANAIASLKARMQMVGVIAPGNFPGVTSGGPRTALYCGSSCLWGGSNVGAGGSINGLSANAGGARWYAVQSYDSAGPLSIQNSGFSIYMPITGGIGAFLDFGGYDGTNGFYAGLNHTLGTVFTIGLAALQAAVAYPGPGFFSFNRTASNVLKVYWGNDTHPIAQIGATVVGDNTTGTFPTGIANGDYFLGAVNSSGAAISTTNNTYSYLSIHDGFSLADVQQEFAAVTAMRTSFGGGHV